MLPLLLLLLVLPLALLPLVLVLLLLFLLLVMLLTVLNAFMTQSPLRRLFLFSRSRLLHGDQHHLMGNMFNLMIFGKMAEEDMGSVGETRDEMTSLLR